MYKQRLWQQYKLEADRGPMYNLDPNVMNNNDNSVHQSSVFSLCAVDKHLKQKDI